MISAFIIVSMLVFAFFAIIWQSKDVFNQIVKLMFILLTAWAMYIIFTERLLR